ncbi:helix-turn-helix transcriptional regulator [Celeribacter halophilus]|uniref:helix-turn-helix transcriptional regulator n=1 Tax=Celeribacter halophilus TaxID=576117 RepID=UPI003A8D8AD4
MYEPRGTDQDVTHPAIQPSMCQKDLFTFIGSQRLFSEVVLRTIETEFDEVRASRFPDLETWDLVLSNHIQPEGQSTRLLIVDERQADRFMSFLEHQDHLTPRVRLAIAVRDDASATEVVERWGARLSTYTVSVLPMNLNLTAWVQLIRLIDCGAHYLPVCSLGAMQAARRERAPSSDNALHDTASHDAAPATSAKDAREDAREEACARGVAKLTPREREVLKLVASGQPNKMIANELSVSAHTIKLHLHRIMTKLGVTNRTEAAICFHSQNC